MNLYVVWDQDSTYSKYASRRSARSTYLPFGCPSENSSVGRPAHHLRRDTWQVSQRYLALLGGTLCLSYMKIQVLELGHGGSYNVDQIAEECTSWQLNHDRNHDFILILGSDIAIPYSYDSGDGPIERVNILGNPPRILNADVLQPAFFWNKLRGEEKEECLNIFADSTLRWLVMTSSRTESIRPTYFLKANDILRIFAFWLSLTITAAITAMWVMISISWLIGNRSVAT